MEIPTAIITAPRRANYLSHTLRTYFTQFPNHRPHIFAEPNTPIVDGMASCSVYWNSYVRGVVDNWYDAIEFIYTNYKSDWYLVTEDDIEWTLGSGDYLRDFLKTAPKNTGFVSPYCSLANGYGKSTRWIEARMVPERGWCGALAICLSRDFAEVMMNHYTKFQAHSKGKHLDYAIGAMAQEHKMQIYTHVPTLVYHLGEQSTLMPENHPLLKSLTREPYVL